MKEELNIYTVAKSRRCDVENEINSKGNSFKYKTTEYFLINREGKLLESETPDALQRDDVCQCIMIHEYAKLERTNSYSWYYVDFIDENNCVHRDKLDERFRLNVDYKDKFANQIIYLCAGNRIVYEHRWPCPERMSLIWELYQRSKLLQTDVEAQVLGKIAMQDESILKLESELSNVKLLNQLLQRERDQYKSMLDEIKELIQKK